MSRIALGLAYDGSAWQGWQTQPHGVTVQDQVEAALASFAGGGGPVATVCAGRTDTGVHAAMQVIHLDTDLQRRDESWVRGVNAFLPPSIVVQWARPVSEAFHARFSARSRMAGTLLGEHDFSSFRSSQCQARHPVRTLHRLDIDERGAFLVFTLRANAFLHHMVRNLIGALLQVGQGRESVAWMDALLRARDRRLGAPTFMPDGLYLSAIEYPAEFGFDELDGGTMLLSPFTGALG